MDRGEEDGVSTGGGEGREEKCDMKTPTHHGGCKTQMRVLLSTHTLFLTHSHNIHRRTHTAHTFPQREQ